MRASRILSGKPDRALIVLAQLCEEREEELVPASVPYAGAAPRLPPIPPQVPYTVGSSQHAPGFIQPVDAKTPPRRLFEPLPTAATASTVSHERKTSVELVEGTTPVLQHMAPTRGKWTSPPPPDAPPSVLDSYRDNLGLGLSIATSSTPAREMKDHSPTSSSASDVLTEDDLRSVASGSQPSSPQSGSEPDKGQKYLPSSKKSVPPAHLQLRKSPKLGVLEHEDDTPKASELSHPHRGRETERTNSNASISTPTMNGSLLPRPPVLPLSNPKRSSSGPPALKSPTLPADPSADASPQATMVDLPTNGHGDHKPAPPLSLDTGYFPPISPSSSPRIKPVPVVNPPPRTAWPEFPSHPYVPPTQQQQLQAHNRSGSSSRHHHSASSGSHYPITLYRTQPQATTFPLYQQVSPPPPPSNFASTSSTPYISSPTYEQVQFKGISGIGLLTSSNGKSPSANHSNSASAATSPRLTNTYSPRLTGSPHTPPMAAVPSALKPESPVQPHLQPSPKIVSSPSVEKIETNTTPPTSVSIGMSMSRNSSIARRKYDPSAAFRIPTTTTIASPSSPSEMSPRSSLFSTTPSSPSSRRRSRDETGSSPISSPGSLAYQERKSTSSRRGTDASLSSSTGSATSGGTDVPEPMFVWPSVR